MKKALSQILETLAILLPSALVGFAWALLGTVLLAEMEERYQIWKLTKDIEQ